MVRNYQRKTTRQQWSAESMRLALQDISNGVPFKRAARIYNLPLTTLKRRAQNQNKVATGHKKCLGRFSTTLPPELETYLKDYVLEMEDRLFGLTKKNVCAMAYELAERNGINHRFSKDKKAAGTAWFKDFLKRNTEISFRTPEATSAARARGFNKEAVGKFFKLLDETVTKNNINSPRMYNMDESGIQTVPSKLPKILAHKGRKQVGFLTSAERGQNVSVVLCVNAAGQFIPPAIIFPRKRRNELLYQGLPYGTLCLYNESGYMKSDTFVQFLQHFKQHTSCSVENKVLLLLDGHSSHKSLQAIEYCRENGIIMLSFPPHCTHELQPLDVSVFSPLMAYFNEEVVLWLKSNPGKVVNLYNISSLFGKAYRRAATLNNGLSGFESTGIFPFNPNIFPDWKYKPSSTTDRPLVADNIIVCEQREQKTPSPLPCTSRAERRKRKASSEFSSDEEGEWEASGRSSDEVSLFSDNGEDLPMKIFSPISDVVAKHPKHSELRPWITPFDISPAPVAPPQTRSSRPSQGATVFTSTPNYLVIKEKLKPSKPPSQAAKKAVTKNVFSTNNRKKEASVQEANTACMFCEELFKESRSKEVWIQCHLCQKWCHLLCASVTGKQKVYICDFCK